MKKLCSNIIGALCLGLGALHAASEKPNIIFFITDDQSKDMFNYTPEGKGKNLCPNIDRLAKEGTILRQHHVSSPVCTPSRFSAMTGTYASRSKCNWLTGPLQQEGQTAVQWNAFITPENDNLPRVLRENGYRTGAVGKNHMVFCEGIDELKPRNVDDPRDPAVEKKLKTIVDMVQKEYYKVGFDYAEHIYHNNPYYIGPLELAVHNQEWVTEAALKYIDSSAGDKPFFLYMATTLPHSPEGEDRSWGADGRLTPEGVLEKAPSGGHPARETIRQRLDEVGIPKGKKREALLWLDDAIGALLNKLEETNEIDNTIIVFLSDHEMGAKGTVYQGGAHTNGFIWRKGGFKAGSELNDFTNNVDFAPTLLDLAGIDDRPEPCDGISFAPALNGISGLERQVLYYEIGYARAVRIGDWKFMSLRYSDKAKNMPREERQKRLDEFNKVMSSQGKKPHNLDPMAPFCHMILIPGGSNADYHSMNSYPGYFDPDQLYNLSKDPNEQVNLAKNPEYQTIVRRMKEALRQELERLPGNFPDFVMR